MTWESTVGRRICWALTLGEHVFTTWADQGYGKGIYTGPELPTAYCMRCGAKL